MRQSTVEKLLQMVLVLHSVVTGIVWFQKISMAPNGRLFDLHTPHPPGFSIPGGGSLMTPLPQGISRIFKWGLGLPPFGNSKWLWHLKTKKVNSNSITKIRQNFITTVQCKRLLSVLFSQTFSFFTITFSNYVCVVFM